MDTNGHKIEVLVMHYSFTENLCIILKHKQSPQILGFPYLRYLWGPLLVPASSPWIRPGSVLQPVMDDVADMHAQELSPTTDEGYC